MPNHLDLKRFQRSRSPRALWLSLGLVPMISEASLS